MDNELKWNPEDPFGVAAAAAAAEAAETAAAAAAAEEKPAAPAEPVFTAEEQEMIDRFAETIDLSDSAKIIGYGSSSQKKISDFSDTALGSVRNKDFGEVGEMIEGLVLNLKELNDDAENEPHGLAKLFHSTKRRIETLKVRYDKCESSVNDIVASLEQHQIGLLKDITMFDELYQLNMTNFKELSMYIAAGKKKLADERETTLAELRQKASESGLPEDAQSAHDFEELCDRFERKLHDLELTRMVSVQMAPQIRLVQSNDSMMTEKIQTVIMNTIPLWKSQMVIALGVEHSQQAMQAAHAVNDMTNELLKKNAEALHQATVDVHRESERGIVDIETLTHTNEQLIQTLDEIQQIQKEGHEKRVAAEEELVRMEAELKEKLIGIANS